MRCVSYNIQWGKGRDGRIDLARIAAAVAGGDVIALQEVERHWRPQDFPDQAARLGVLLPGFHWVYGAAVDLAGPLPNRRRQIGNMVLSRYPIAACRTLPLPSWPVSGHVNDHQQMIEAVIGGRNPFRLYNTHLNYLSPEIRLDQLSRALAMIGEAPRHGAAVTLPDVAALGPEDEWIVLPDGVPPVMPEAALLAGDFNCQPGSAEHARILASGFVTALPGADITYPGHAGHPPQALDHIFLSPHMAPGLQGAWVDAEAQGSDHQPVWVEIDWLP